ncbi:MAG TPA: hypothetical protein RMH99_09750 [Sandaracinaceae bacterium LLY-WYZ-13_1]|nr:hypothetical protein [Sandaracinaceae bacterium LLY-WYZ-13_1]
MTQANPIANDVTTNDDGSVDLDAYEPNAAAPTLFRHSLREKWGLGMVIRKLDDRVMMQFQDGRKRTFVDRFYHLIEAVDRPLDTTMGIVSGLRSMFEGMDEGPRMTNERRKDPVSLDEQILYFRELFADGFQSEDYEATHRGDGRKRPLKRHRDAAVEKAREVLPKSAFSGDPTEVHAAASKVLNLTDLVPAKERKAFAAIEPEHHEAIATTLRALLYGESKLTNRFDAWVRALERALGEEPTWQLATALPGLIRPDQHPAVRIKTYERQAKWMAPGLRMSDRPMGLLYTRLAAMMQAVRERLVEKGLKPRDYLDVRDFMWLTLKPAGRKRIMEIRHQKMGSEMHAVIVDDDGEIVGREGAEAEAA